MTYFLIHQLDVILKAVDALYTIESHRRSHAVTCATARADLLHLAQTGLLTEGKRDKGLTYTVPADLPNRLSDLK